MTSDALMQDLNDLTVDFLLLADRAEAVNNKLYLMGGAWDQIGVQDFQQPIVISFALGIIVPWNATNQQHTLAVSVADSDNNILDFRVEMGFITGRPPTLELGEPQRVSLAVPGVPLRLPRPGTYILRAEINGHLAKTVRFKANSIQMAIPPGLGPSRG